MSAAASTTDTRTTPVSKAGLIKMIGMLGILGGVVLVVAGTFAWIMISSQLRSEGIVVPDDAVAFQGQTVSDPLSALAQADVIQTHAMDASGGKTYAELSQDDPIRPMVMEASLLRASLFTSILSFGVAALVMGLGVLTALFGLALRRIGAAWAVKAA